MSAPSQTDAPTVNGADAARGAMGAPRAATDASRAGIGAPASWSPALSTMVRLVEASRMPMSLWWGPTFCQVHSPALVHALNAPQTPMGQPSGPGWQVWPVLEPLIEASFRGGGATWHDDVRLGIDRRGAREETRWSIALDPIADETTAGGIGGVLGTFCQITARTAGERRLAAASARRGREEIDVRERNQEALRVSEERFRSYFDIGLIGLAITSVDRGVLEVNAELCRILGYDREELLRMHWSELTHPDDLDADVAAFQRVMDGELDGYRLDKRWIRKDGQVIDSVMAARCTRFADGSVDYFVALVLDTTERRKAERALAESERRFRLLAESIPHHVWSFRPGAEAGPGQPPAVGYWNQRLADYTGLTPEQLQRGGWEALHPDDVAGARVAWQWARAHGSMYEMEQRLRGREGRYRRFLCRAMPVFDHRGAAVEWFGTHSDIEDRRAAEEALQRSQAELAHVARATTVGEFAASIAHEINQPLAAVVLNGTACTRWLAADPPDLREAAEAADRIVHDANRAAEIIQRIRLFLQRGKAERSVLSLAAAVSEILAMVEGQLREKAIVLDVAFAADLPPVLGDRVQLQQVILNLAMNAIEAMASVAWRKRELAVRVDRHDGRSLRVSLRDTGVGLAPDDRERIFEPFHTTKESGMGMGLAISRAIVEAHGGRLWVTANADHGETFQFTLPAAPESLEAVA